MAVGDRRLRSPRVNGSTGLASIYKSSDNREPWMCDADGNTRWSIARLICPNLSAHQRERAGSANRPFASRKFELFLHARLCTQTPTSMGHRLGPAGSFATVSLSCSIRLSGNGQDGSEKRHTTLITGTNRCGLATVLRS